MHLDDLSRFLTALLAMGMMFKDDVTKERQRLYWELMRGKCRIEEWEYACTRALEQHSFHALPLPAELMPFVYEYREEERRLLLQQHATVAEAERLALEASPEWQDKERQRKADLKRQEEAAYRFLATRWGANWREEPPATPELDRHWALSPTEAPEVIKARLRAQAAQIQCDERDRKEAEE